jgi:thiamine pyrophosphate-dependent acetolactate synthase large subunit-like protein
MDSKEAIGALVARKGDAIAVCALGMAAGEWWRQTHSDDDFYLHGAMGFSSSFALGLALGLPQAKVWLINSDGSLCMNPGCLLTEAAQAPANLKHFVLDNQVYETVGSIPMVNQRRTNYAALALAAGFTSARTVETVEELAEAFPAIEAANGPTLTVLRVTQSGARSDLEPMNYEGPELKYRFGRSIERRYGVNVFGKQGY